jgi:hypothetical protein
MAFIKKAFYRIKLNIMQFHGFVWLFFTVCIPNTPFVMCIILLIVILLHVLSQWFQIKELRAPPSEDNNKLNNIVKWPKYIFSTSVGILGNSKSNWGGFVEHLSGTKVAQQSVTKIISLIFVNLATPKAQAKQEFLFNKLASEVGLLNIYVILKKGKVWPNTLWWLWFCSHLKLGLSMSCCSANPSLIRVCWTSKFDLSSSTMCDQNHIPRHT